MSGYKQWDAATRARMQRLHHQEIAAGRFKGKCGPCEMCGQSKTVGWHAEEYGPTYFHYVQSLHSLCARCHAMVHLRFRFPGRWAVYKAKVREGPQKATSLHMMFRFAYRQKDVPMPATVPMGDGWWEKLETARHVKQPRPVVLKGPRQPLLFTA